MEGIVLAGGFGTRLRAIIPDLPKPMAPIAGRPFLEILLQQLSTRGFRRVVLSVGYMAEKIVAHFGSRYASMDIEYAVEAIPLGTGGAVRLSLQRTSGDHAYIFNGDTYLDLDTDAVEALWQRNRNPVIVARKVSDTARFGRLTVCDGRVTGFAEKGVAGPGLINAGCYVFNRAQLNEFPLGQPFSLETGYLARFVSSERFDLFVSDGDFIDIGLPTDYARAQTELAP